MVINVNGCLSQLEMPSLSADQRGREEKKKKKKQHQAQEKEAAVGWPWKEDAILHLVCVGFVKTIVSQSESEKSPPRVNVLE